MYQSRQASEELQSIREQLELFSQIETNVPCESSEYEDEDWDYATANTKTETHCFHTYPAMMIPQVARRLIKMFAQNGDSILDPFCGSGTVLVEAKIAGLPSYGIDINPLACLIARAKTTPVNVKILRQQALSLLNDFLEDTRSIEINPDYSPIPAFFNIDYWFKPNVSHLLSALRSRIFAISDVQVREFFLVAFSETVREASYTRKGEFKLYRIRKDKLDEYNPNVGEIFFTKVCRNISGMEEFIQKVDTNAQCEVLREDTRNQTSVPAKSINLIVTSPPYGDSKTTVAYGQFSRLSLQWLGFEEARDIDNRLLGGRRKAGLDFASHTPTLQSILEKIALKDKKRVLDVNSFYHDFSLCFQEIARVCVLGAKACLVVGNRTVKGIKIPTDRIIVEIGEKFGFTHIETFQRNIPNKRMPSKNSPSNVQGELGNTMTKEHILIMKKAKEN